MSKKSVSKMTTK